MITCASERSGIASSGAFRNDSQPHMPRPAMNRIVISGFRALPAIRWPMTPILGSGSVLDIGVLPERARRPHAALGRDEEVAGAHDDVAILDAADDLDVVAARS